jgi:hypothetical protein
VVVKAAAADPKTVDEKGPVATSYRLSEALLVAPRVKKFFAQDLMTENGLNIEGLAVVGGKLYAGLRAPVSGRSLIWSVWTSTCFSTAPGPLRIRTSTRSSSTSEVAESATLLL